MELNIVERIVMVAVWCFVILAVSAGIFCIVAMLLAKRITKTQERVEHLISIGGHQSLRYRITYFCFHRKQLERIIAYQEEKQQSDGKA